MPIKPLPTALLALTALLAGCGDGGRVSISQTSTDDTGDLRAVTTLQCPQEKGALVRTAQAADGLSCTYGGPRGAEVSLRLIRLADGQTPASALGPLEAEVRDTVPEAVSRAQTPPMKAEAASSGRRDEADVNLPGMHVQTQGQATHVRLPGISVDSRRDGTANVSVGPIHVNADENSGRARVETPGQSVQVRSGTDAAEIRAAGTGEGIRQSYMVVSDRPSGQGWRLVGFEARGPRTGPIVAAVVRGRDREHGRVFDDAKDLVTLNVGR